LDFSRRTAFLQKKLIFEGNSVFWKCRAINHQEHIDCDSLDDANGHGVPWETSALAISASRGPRLDEYARLVEAYSERKLSFPEDKL
jgi:hypothetical protein